MKNRTNLQRTRRDAIKQAAAVSTVFAVPWIIPASALGREDGPGANERISIGVIGCGVRGKYLIANVPPVGRVVSLCDCSLSEISTTLADPKAISLSRWQSLPK